MTALFAALPGTRRFSPLPGSRRLSPLAIALLFSLLAHAALLSIRFISQPGPERTLSARPLEVILVNAHSNERPDEAKALAQVALSGGGDADSGRATSPTPYSALARPGQDSEESQQSQETARERQNRVLAELRQQIAELPVPEPRRENLPEQQAALEERRLMLVRQLAEIERLVRQENERPRKHYVSPATMDSVSALYLDSVRRAIEVRGTRDFPTRAGDKLYGSLIVTVLINHDGSVVATHIDQSSGNPGLDRRAEAIVYAAAPFGPFGPQLRRKTDQIGFTSTFEFKRDATVATRVHHNTH